MVGEEQLFNNLGNFEGFSTVTDSSILALLIGLIAVFLIIAIFVFLAVYIYSSFAFMSLARKTKYPRPGIAWIPFVGPSLIISNAAKMHWWPVLFLLGLPFPFIDGLCFLIFYVFFVIWLWKTYEKVNYPGWFSLFMIMPPFGLIFLGVVAWGNRMKNYGQKKKK